jgi:hypothetical protein
MRIVQYLVCFVAFSFLAPIDVVCQVLVWSVPPSQYVDIEQIGYHTYKVKGQDGRCGVVSLDGKAIQGLFCDEITPFYHQWALIISHEGNRRTVIGSLCIDGTCHQFKDTFFTLTGMEFYSDGMLPVENHRGVKVYVDYNGNECIGSGEKYYRIMPFSEGMAVVFASEDYSYLIDKRGQKVSINSRILNGVTLRHALNAYQGLVPVWDDHGNYFNYNVNDGTVTEVDMPAGKIPFDYLFRFSGQGSRLPYDGPYTGYVDNGIKPFVKEGRYGYIDTKNDNVLLPCQLTLAMPFIDGYAIVKMPDKKCGILKCEYDDNLSFEISALQKTIQYSPDEQAICEFKVLVPKSWADKNVTVTVKGISNLSSKGNGIYAFALKPKSASQRFEVSLNAQGLELFSSGLEYIFKQKGKAIEKPMTNSENKSTSSETPKSQQQTEKKKQDSKKEQEKKKEQERKKKEQERKKQEQERKKQEQQKNKKRPDII